MWVWWFKYFFEMHMFFHWNFNSWFPQVFPNFYLYGVLVIFGPKMKIFSYIIQQNQKYTTSKTGVRTAQSPIEQKLWPFFGFRHILRFLIFYADFSWYFNLWSSYLQNEAFVVSQIFAVLRQASSARRSTLYYILL